MCFKETNLALACRLGWSGCNPKSSAVGGGVVGGGRVGLAEFIQRRWSVFKQNRGDKTQPHDIL